MFRLLLILLALMPALGLAQIPPQPGRAVPPAVPSPGIARPFTRPGAPAQPGAAAADPNAKPAMRPEDAIKADGSVELQYPNTPLSEILLLYEELTGLKIIRDANAEQATVSIETTGQLPKEKAIMFIEKSLLLNGYAFTPAGEGMVKLLAFDAKKPSMEGAPLIESAMDLPQTDQVVSHVVTLKFLNSEDATKAIDQVIPRHSYGVITPVPNARSLVITENSNTIRSIIALLEKLDNKPVETVQKTIQLTRSSAEDVKKALDEILGTSDKSGSSKTPAIPQNTPGTVPGQPISVTSPGGAGSAGGASSTEAAPPKIISITRRNCLLVIGAQDQVDYISKLVEELDAASELRNFASRPLKYLAVETAMQIISDAISRTEGDDSAASGGGTGTSSTSTQNTNSQNRNNNNSSSLFNNNSNSLGSNGMNGGLGGGGGLGGSSSFGSGGGNLTPLRENNGPTSMLIGKTLLISDPVANSIYASGPPEHLRILNEIMDELDHRPQQIIISALIGDYQTTENKGFSLEAAFRGRRGNGSGGLFGQIGASPGLPTISTTTTNNNNNNNNNGNTTTTTNNILDPRAAIGAAANYAIGNGFSFYGGIHQGLDMLVNTLETDNNFKVLARPTIFTQNNTPATLTSGLSFPIAASTQSSLVGGVNNNSFLSNVQYQDIVLSLNIIPLINSEDELTLQISQQNSERAGNTTITDNVYPIISKQELNTVIACRNNSTVLLGGLIRNDENKTGSRVPILASIPVLNKILGSRTRDRSARELLIFIQPRIVKGLDDLPPSIHDSVGSSAFGDEAQAAFNLERNALDRARLNATLETEKPRFTQRMKALLNRIILND